MNEERFKQAAAKFISGKYRRQSDAADALGISQTYMSFVSTGKRPPPDSLIRAMGYTKVIKVTYVREKS